MHLWPSLRIRDSFKLDYLKKLEWNLHRMKSEKDSSSNQKLLDNEKDDDGGNAESEFHQKIFGILGLCKDFLMILSCCYCCFCCGEFLGFFSPHIICLVCWMRLIKHGRSRGYAISYFAGFAVQIPAVSYVAGFTTISSPLGWKTPFQTGNKISTQFNSALCLSSGVGYMDPPPSISSIQGHVEDHAAYTCVDGEEN